MAAPMARRRITPLPRRMAPTRHRRTRVHRPTPTPRTPARLATTRRATRTTGRPATRPSTMATTLASTLATPITRARTASLRTPTLTGATRTIGRLHEYSHGGIKHGLLILHLHWGGSARLVFSRCIWAVPLHCSWTGVNPCLFI